ncbi:MAG: GNAT family N-acetyltransferase [Janthinobacterium lividum]
MHQPDTNTGTTTAPRAGGGTRRAVELLSSVLTGRAAVEAALDEIIALTQRCEVPATAGGAWLRAGLGIAAPAAVWAVLVSDVAEGLRAAAVLVDTFEGGERRALLMVGGGGYRAAVAALDDSAATELGRAVASEADVRGCDLHLGELVPDDLLLAMAWAADARVETSIPVPLLERPADPSLPLFSGNVRKTLRKAHNRLAADGIELRAGVTRDPEEIIAALPELELAYRDRDEAHGLVCSLDTPAGLATWSRRLRELARDDLLELSTLHTTGDPHTPDTRGDTTPGNGSEELVAYVIGVRDGSSYGILEGRFHTRWARYAPGRLLESAVLERAFLDPSVAVVDWMTGVAPETLLATNRTQARVVLHRSCRSRGAAVNGSPED